MSSFILYGDVMVTLRWSSSRCHYFRTVTVTHLELATDRIAKEKAKGHLWPPGLAREQEAQRQMFKSVKSKLGGTEKPVSWMSITLYWADGAASAGPYKLTGA